MVSVYARSVPSVEAYDQTDMFIRVAKPFLIIKIMIIFWVHDCPFPGYIREKLLTF